MLMAEGGPQAPALAAAIKEMPTADVRSAASDLMAEKKYDKAAGLLAVKIDDETTDPGLITEHARALTAVGEAAGVRQGIAELRRAEAAAADNLPARADVRVALGDAHGRLAEYHPALELYYDAYDDDPQNEEADLLNRPDSDAVLRELHDGAAAAEAAADPYQKHLAWDRAVVVALAARSPLEAGGENDEEAPAPLTGPEDVIRMIGRLQEAADAEGDPGAKAQLEVQLAEALMDIGAYKDALFSFDNALLDDPENDDATVLLPGDDIPTVLETYQRQALQAEKEGHPDRERYLRNKAVVTALAAHSPLDEPPAAQAPAEAE